MSNPQEQPTFIMFGARDAINGGMSHISTQVYTLERAVVTDPALAFDLSKTVVESTCKTIITERGGVFGTSDNLPNLFGKVSQLVSFLPTGSSGDATARRSLLKTLSGMSTALQGVCELRNAHGSVSHGSDGPRSSLESAQAMLAAQAADTIIGFLFRVHKRDMTQPGVNIKGYDGYPDFNDWVDEQCELIQILTSPSYLASDVLYSVDEDAYHVLRAEYESANQSDEEPDTSALGEVVK